MLIASLTCAACTNGEPEPTASVAHPHHTVITALIWAPDWPEEMHQIVDAFQRLNPAVRVNVQFMIGNSVEENIKPRVASHRLPDLVSVNPNAYAAELGEQGMLVDLAQSPAWENMLEALKADWTTAGQKHYGTSGGVAANLIYYNMEMFRRAGIERIPTDFDQFLQVCQQLRRAGMTPIMWNGGFPNMLGNGPFSSGFANNFVAQDPGWKQKLNKGTLALDSPAGEDIFAKIKVVAQRGYAQDDFMVTGYDEGIRLFTEGRTAMIFHGTWASGMLMHGKDFTTGTFIPPWNARGHRAVPVLGSETGFAIGATPHRKEALAFLEFMMGPGYMIQQNKRQNIPPMKQPQGKMIGDPRLYKYVETLSAYPVTVGPYYSFLPSAAIELTHSLMQEVLLDKITPRQAAASLDRLIKSEAKKNNK